MFEAMKKLGRLARVGESFNRHVLEMGETQTARKCAVCEEPAVRVVFRQTTVKGRQGVDWSSRRFLCGADHVLEVWPERVKVKRGFRMGVRRDRDAGLRGDMSNEYSHMVKEMGGEVPMPDREKPVRKRKKVWEPVHRSTVRFVSSKTRTRRAAGMSGRQWVKFRKAEGLGSKSR